MLKRSQSQNPNWISNKRFKIVLENNCIYLIRKKTINKLFQDIRIFIFIKERTGPLISTVWTRMEDDRQCFRNYSLKQINKNDVLPKVAVFFISKK